MGVTDVMLGWVGSVLSVPNGQADSCRESCFMRSMCDAAVQGWGTLVRGTISKGRFVQGTQHPELSVGTHRSGTHQPRKRCDVSPSPNDVSPTENSWMLHPLDKVSLGYFAPDRTIPSLHSDFLIAF